MNNSGGVSVKSCRLIWVAPEATNLRQGLLVRGKDWLPHGMRVIAFGGVTPPGHPGWAPGGVNRVVVSPGLPSR